MSTLTSSKPVAVLSTAIPQERLVSLDVFRGVTIAAMILVNDNGSDAAYWPLKHTQWNGWTPTDLVFPFFLFIVGISLVFSFQSRLKRGDSKGALVLHAFKRSVILFAIGLFINAYPHFHLATWRIPGVLQRIAVAYFVAAVLTLYVNTSARIAVAACLLAGYWILMRFVPVPGYGVPGVDIPLLHPDWNLTAYIDRKLLFGHLYEGTRDPEGLLSTLPSIATAVFGVVTGEWLRSERSQMQKARGMLLFGVLGVITGKVWNIWFPINKKLWTSSYVLFVAGLALICLAICYWLIDIQKRRGAWIKPFLIFGTNAITAYVISEVLASTLFHIHAHLGNRTVYLQEYIFWRWFGWIAPQALASLAYSLAFVLVCFLPIWWMYRKKIFLRV
jgi:predicted acyltransferase